MCSSDLDPVPVHQRLWGPWNFVAFWLADSININTWMIGRSQNLDKEAYKQCPRVLFSACLGGKHGSAFGLATPSPHSLSSHPVEWEPCITSLSQSSIARPSVYGDRFGLSLTVAQWPVSGTAFKVGSVASACTS